MPAYKQVPALIKCANILEFLSRSQTPRSLADICNRLGYNRSTVFNLVHTLTNLGLLERGPGGQFRLGPRLYVLAQAGGQGPDLIQVARPVLEEINRRTRLTTLLGSLYGERVVIVDLVESSLDMRISSRVGMRIPLLAGVTGMIMLMQMNQAQVEELLAAHPLEPFTRFSVLDPRRYARIIDQARVQGGAVDRETYLEGVRGVGVPVAMGEGNPLCALWVIGLNQHIPDQDVPDHLDLLKESARQIEMGLWLNRMTNRKPEP